MAECETSSIQKDDPELRAKARMELVRRTICPKGIGEDEFALFWEQCQRSGLDPLLKEAFCVGRRMNAGTKERPNWITKHEFQPSEAGMLARAERFPDFKGIQASAVYAEDEILVDQGAGEVVHKFNPAKRKGSLVGAWARVVRRDKLPVVVWLDFQGYVQQTPLWAKIPTTMIEKCARVAALRKAYPEAFGGLYIGEEMPPEDTTPAPADDGKAKKRARGAEEAVVEPVRPALPPPDPMTALEQKSLNEQLERARQQVAAATPPPQPVIPADLPATPADPAPKAGEERPREETHVEAGPSKGKEIIGLDDVQLESAVDFMANLIKEHPRAKWRDKASRNLAALQAELHFRKSTPVAAQEAQAS